jgi:hypothetical protein
MSATFPVTHSPKIHRRGGAQGGGVEVSTIFVIQFSADNHGILIAQGLYRAVVNGTLGLFVGSAYWACGRLS